ncbi:MAG: AEC family transporter [Hyphomicrobiales bacterium]|nr:AEC family transporter [Alphaproteobacteria bacterium]
MIDVLNLALPYFGLIFLGFACGRFKSIPDSGFAWMDFFIVYLSLPALFFRILAQTPFQQLNNVRFILATTLATFLVLVLSFCLALAIRRNLAESAIGALAGAYGNTGYMGPGLALATVGAQAAAPVALIFCFETMLFFSLLPLMMAIARPTSKSPARLALEVARKIFLHPFVVATALGVASAALHVGPPAALDRLLQFLQNASAPCALFTLGVTVALRPFTRVPWEVPFLVTIKLVVHPLIALSLMIAFGPFDPDWVKTVVLMAALPPALNVFVLGRQYGAWVEPASGSVLLGTLVSVATLTTVMWLVQNGGLTQVLLR